MGAVKLPRQSQTDRNSIFKIDEKTENLERRHLEEFFQGYDLIYFNIVLCFLNKSKHVWRTRRA